MTCGLFLGNTHRTLTKMNAQTEINYAKTYLPPWQALHIFAMLGICNGNQIDMRISKFEEMQSYLIILLIKFHIYIYIFI